MSFVTPSTSAAISSPNSSRIVVDVDVGVLDDVVEERGGDRLLVEAKLDADPRDADRMRDERLAGAALLAFVRGGGEAEGARDELDADVAALRGELGEQALEELLVPLTCLDRCHFFSVLRHLSARTSAGGTAVTGSEVTVPMLTIPPVSLAPRRAPPRASRSLSA